MAVCEKTAEVHIALQQSASALKVVQSKMASRISVHTMPETTTFGSLFGFQKIARQLSHETKSFIGSIAGNIVLSVNTAHATTAGTSRKKKRGRDTAAEEADRAVRKVERSGVDADKVSAATFNAARACLTEMLRTRGANNESVIESWAVSLRVPGAWGSTSNGEGVPSVVVGFRLAAGVAIPLGKLCAALRTCRDGLATTSAERINADFNLPLSDQGSAAQESGQKSILLLASVPHLADPAPPDPATK